MVTSREIDRRGEEGDEEDEVRRYIDDVLDKLRKGIRRLAALDVTHFIISADHGYLFQESLESGMQMDAPGGETREIHRRYWIGSAAVSVYGFEEGTREIQLEKGKANPITLMLTDSENIQTASVHILDVVTQKELARLEQIPVEILF